MFTLFITMCLATNPTHCQVVQPYEPVTQLFCQTYGEAGAVEYLKDHPEYTLRRWECLPGGRRTPI